VTQDPHYALLASLPATSFLEIGVQEGFSLAAVVGASVGLKSVTLCDTWGALDGGTNRGSHAHIDKLLDDLGYTGERLFLDGDSKRTVPYLGRATKYDLIHVDGDHTEAGAYADLTNVTPIASWHIVVHDIFMPSVWAACSRWLKENTFTTVRAYSHGTGALVVEV
jgi:hypothetical protein